MAEQAGGWVKIGAMTVAVVTMLAACLGELGSDRDDQGGLGAGGSSGGGSGGGTTTGTGGSTSGSGGAGGEACASDCPSIGDYGCSPAGDELWRCADVGGGCLKWQVLDTCAVDASCDADAGACVPLVAPCCTPDGVGCCTGDYGGDCCPEAADCVLETTRNGSELCDDQGFGADPDLNRYFLVCLNANGGVGYVSSNSGPPCGNPVNARCQCWEDQGQAPWDYIQYVGQLVCDQPGKRIEITPPQAGTYWVGAHPQPGNYPLNGYCPAGDGCMTCVGIIEIPK